MYEKLREVQERYEELGTRLQDPRLVKDRAEFVRVSKEHSDLAGIVETFQRYQDVERRIAESQEMLADADPEIRELAKADLDALQADRARIEPELKLLLVPKDPFDEKNILLEIRAGTGGEEAALFAANLFRMYARYAERQGWRIESMSRHETGLGGLKEIICLIDGKRVYSRLKYESGVHRVQRVPTTEAQGRIHTSAVTVAILPEADDVDVRLEPADLRIDVYRSSGPGGQSVNTTDSAVRVTHVPSGLVVTCQDEKSQHKNKAKALKILQSRLLEAERERQQQEMARTRKSQVGSGDRSERIRTYNFPQSRMTDHRIGLTLYKLDAILDGDLEDIVDALTLHYQSEALRADG
jgi:peptide chain release factor 1